MFTRTVRQKRVVAGAFAQREFLLKSFFGTAKPCCAGKTRMHGEIRRHASHINLVSPTLAKGNLLETYGAFPPGEILGSSELAQNQIRLCTLHPSRTLR